MGKGSTRRPTDEKTYQDNFDRIFRHHKGETHLPTRRVALKEKTQ
jgi:hypothetical protein